MAKAVERSLKMGDYLTSLEGGFTVLDIWDRAKASVGLDDDPSDGLAVTTNTGDQFELVSEKNKPGWYHWTGASGLPISRSFFLDHSPDLLVAADDDGDGDPDLFVGAELGFGFMSINLGAELAALSSDDNKAREKAAHSIYALDSHAFGWAKGALQLAKGTPALRGCPASIPYFPSASILSRCAASLSEKPLLHDFHDNYVTNEARHDRATEFLRERGGAYLGVGPYQNYTLIARTQPLVAVITDIRRSNVLQHLIVKALVLAAETRFDFLTRLLMRQVKLDVRPPVSVKALLDQIQKLPPVAEEEAENMIDSLCRTIEDEFDFPLTESDHEAIRAYMMEFWKCGFHIEYQGCPPGGLENTDITFNGFVGMPKWGRTIAGDGKSVTTSDWLGNEASYQVIRSLHNQNRIIPIVGDLSGSKTLRAVGDLLRRWGLAVNYFYTSNVEMWLLGDAGNALKQFYDNVASLPIGDRSEMIRGCDVPADGSYKVVDLPSNWNLCFVDLNAYLRHWNRGAIRSDTSPDLYLNAALSPNPAPQPK